MKKVMLDSSVWLSYILKDSNFQRATTILKKTKRLLHLQIIIPEIILIEITNVLHKLSWSSSKIELNISAVIFERNILINTSDHIWKKALNVKIGRLKSLDYLIILQALATKVDQFYTFDINQKNAYENYQKEKK